MERSPEQKPQNRNTAFISWRSLGFGFLLLLTLTGGILFANHVRGSKIDRGMHALTDAFSRRRMIEPRLSGGFKGGEFKASTEDMSGVKIEEVEKAQDLITDAAAMGDPAADLPYARLLISKSEKLPEALRYLRRVVARTPESAEAHNDLGVCLLQQEKIEDAIDEFELALKHRSDMPEALFNRALSYQRLLLKDAARNEFHRASEVDRDDSWRIEISQRIEKLAEAGGQQKSADPVSQFYEALTLGRIDDAGKVVRENSETFRTHALRILTIQYLQNGVDGDSQSAVRNLSNMDLIAGVLSETMSDSITADIAAYIRNLSDSARGTELPLIKQYVENSRRAMSDETMVAFERLEKNFRSTGNYVFEALSAYRVADHYYYLRQYKKSFGKLKQLLSSVQSRQWPFDRARFLTSLALQISRLGQDSLAIKYFQQAVALCSESPGLESKVLQYMSVPYLQLGDTDRALERLRDSTNTILESSRPTALMPDLAYNYFEIARIYSLRNNHSLALLCAEQALSYCDVTRNSGYAAEFSSFVAVENSRLNQPEEADANLDRAFKYLEATEQSSSRNMAEARVLINGIQVAAQSGDTQRALGYFARAESLAKDAEGTSLLMIDLLQARAAAQIASGDNEGARSDLIRAVSQIESYRANIATSEERSQFLDASHRVYDQLISIDAGPLNRVPEAFELSERSRARALLEEISHSSSVLDQNVDHSGERSSDRSGISAPVAPLSLANIQSKLPDDVTVLQYSVTGNGSYLFLITRSELKVKATTATTETLDQLAREYISLLQTIAPLDEVKAKGQELYDYLIKPVEKELNGVLNLVIVPDKALHFLPFSGLVDGNDRYLVDSYRLSYAPSASVLIRCLKEDEAHTGGGTERILTVGNPRPLSENSPKLPPLHDAEREADQSARFYDPSSLTLTGARATEPMVRSAMMECDVAHLAVHCVVDDRSPWLAALVLASTTPVRDAPLSGRADSTPAGGADVEKATRSSGLPKAVPQEPVGDANDGMLYLNELYGIKLPRTRLVVLSACKSGLGQYYRGEGIVSLVRPLLAAGVPTIVASLWPVDSKATSDLMIEFHRQRKRSAGTLAAEALRKAQIELVRTYPHPYYWAPFVVVGSGVASR